MCLLGFAFADSAIADESLPKSTVTGAAVETLIAEYFPDHYATMRAVALCESRLMHRVDGKLVQNSGTASGAFQVLMSVHKKEMLRMGLDPNNDSDYMEYVRYLYDTEGLQPWSESRHCWKHKVPA